MRLAPGSFPLGHHLVSIPLGAIEARIHIAIAIGKQVSIPLGAIEAEVTSDVREALSEFQFR